MLRWSRANHYDCYLWDTEDPKASPAYRPSLKYSAQLIQTHFHTSLFLPFWIPFQFTHSYISIWFLSVCVCVCVGVCVCVSLSPALNLGSASTVSTNCSFSLTFLFLDVLRVSLSSSLHFHLFSVQWECCVCVSVCLCVCVCILYMCVSMLLAVTLKISFELHSIKEQASCSLPSATTAIGDQTQNLLTGSQTPSNH